jgi:hypothetical protein
MIFNRPDTTEQVFSSIRMARPSRLYVAADGPRAGREGEKERCADARRIATDVDWPCEVETLFRDENLGCRRAVSEAISWFFEREEEGIILEDDCLPDPSFFRYCSELLKEFREEDRIMAVCGGGYSKSASKDEPSYFFSRVFDPWGWATWRRAWRHYNDSMTGVEDLFTHASHGVFGPGADLRGHYWRQRYFETKEGKNNSWGYRWTFSIFQRSGLVVYPKRNLISNIGWGEGATHTSLPKGHPGNTLASLPVSSMDFSLSPPTSILVQEEFEKELYHLRLGVVKRGPFGNILFGLRKWISNKLSQSAKDRIKANMKIFQLK